MALERLTQITEVGIQSGITLRNVNVEGAYVSGVVTATSLNITSAGANFTGVVTATSFVGNVTGNINPTSLNVSGVSTFGSNVFLGDGDIAYFGDGNDLLIWHNGSDSLIRDDGTGDLFIQGGNRIRLTNPTGIETYAVFNQDGSSELWYDNVKRLETSGIGVSITSALTVGTGASVSSPATNVLTLGTNDSERVRVDSSGNLGIGTVTPYRNIHLNSNTTESTIKLTNSTSGSGTLDGLDIKYEGLNLSINNRESGSIIFETNNTTRTTITGVGTFLIGTQTATANGGVLQVSNGITFPATQSACSDANTLDDYEEGTWTPTFTFSGGGTPSYSFQKGGYVKVGQLVHVFGFLQCSNVSGCTGTVRLSGLPFTAYAGSDYWQTPSFGYYGGLTGITAYGLGCEVQQNNTIAILTYGTGTGGATLGASNITNTFFIEWSFPYRANA